MESDSIKRPESRPGPPYLQTLGNGLKVILVLADSEPLSLRRLAQINGMSRSTMHRLLHTLVEHGFVARNPINDTYQLGLRVWELGVRAIDTLGVRRALSEQLRKLCRDYGETGHLTVYVEGDVVYVDKVDGWQSITSYSRLGGRAPAYCVATGKALLAKQPEGEVQRVIDAGLVRYSESTIVYPDSLRRELADTRVRGYSVNHGEWRRDVGGVAVAIEEPLTGDLFGLGFSGPIERIEEQADELAQVLLSVRDSVRSLPDLSMPPPDANGASRAAQRMSIR